MGAGAKCDPTRIQISDISYTIYDPLARSVRRRLRLQGVSSGIPVVYSTEVPGDVKLLPLPEEEFQKGDVKELGVFDDFRVRILPVLGACLLCEFSSRQAAPDYARRPTAISIWLVYSHLCDLRNGKEAHFKPSTYQKSQKTVRASPEGLAPS